MTSSTQSPCEGELIARLRARRGMFQMTGDSGWRTASWADADCQQSADTIERLTERVARMEEALKPFANAADMFMETTGDGFPASGIIGPDITGLTLGDLRAARLSRQDPKEGG